MTDEDTYEAIALALRNAGSSHAACQTLIVNSMVSQSLRSVKKAQAIARFVDEFDRRYGASLRGTYNSMIREAFH